MDYVDGMFTTLSALTLYCLFNKCANAIVCSLRQLFILPARTDSAVRVDQQLSADDRSWG